MPKQILAFLLLLVSSQNFAQGYKADFDKVFKENDTAGQRQLLHDWQKANPRDAELFIAFFNYYFFSSRKEVIALTDSTSEPASLAITDSAGLQVGYLTEDFDYDSAV